MSGNTAAWMQVSKTLEAGRENKEIPDTRPTDRHFHNAKLFCLQSVAAASARTRLWQAQCTVARRWSRPGA